MNNQIMFSVVIPLYNKENYIKRAIDSVINQHFKNFELLIVDDGSTDDGRNKVSQYIDKRIRLIVQKNQGVSAARNTGIENAKGEFIALLDADDEWTEEHLSDIKKMINKYPNAGIYSTAYKIIEADSTIHNLWKKFNNIKEIYIINYFKESCMDIRLPVTASSVCIPKNIFEASGVFRIGFPRGEDLDLWGRIALYNNVIFCNNCTVTYYKDTINRSIEKTDIGELPFVDSIKRISKKDIKIMDNIYVKEYVAMQKFIRIKIYLFSNNRLNARKALYKTETTLQKKKWLLLFILSFIPVSVLKFLFLLKGKLF